MVSITAILCSFLYTNVQTLSPEIYVYVSEPVTTDVSIEIEDGVTKTIPEIPLGKKVTWKDVQIDTDGDISYEGKDYPFLYYEGRFQYNDLSQGWMISKENDQMYFNNKLMTSSNLINFLEVKMKESGLFDNEISFLITRLNQNDMIEFSSNYLIINYIPMNDVNDVIKITTSHNFEIMRRHFLIYETDLPIELEEPRFEEIIDTGFLIHETAINRI